MSTGRYAALAWLGLLLALVALNWVDRAIGRDDPLAPWWQRRWAPGLTPAQREVGFLCVLLWCAVMAATT